jgi:hypothetical protein
MRLFLFGCGLALLSASACGGDERKPSPRPSTGGTSGSGGKGGSSNTGTSGEGGASGEAGAGGVVGGQAGSGGSGAPTVTITSPVEVTDPNEGGVLSGMEFRVVCAVQGDFDDSTVQIEMVQGNAEPVEMDGSAAGENEFTADFFLNELETGPVSFRCSAEHSTDSNLVGTDQVDTFVDHGPTITPIEPKVDGFYRLIGAMQFQFSVEPTPLTADDDGAEVDEVHLRVLGVDIDDLTKIDTNLYEATIDFEDEQRFTEPPVGSVPVVIQATNKRDPAIQRTYEYSFTIDAEGPVITITSPQGGDVVGGEIALEFTVVDPGSGVEESSVTVELNDGVSYTFGDEGGWIRAGNEFTYTFDATLLGVSEYQATINITATDLAGNESVEGASAVYYLDNVPPIVDLDPGFVREREIDDNICSRAFDPLGVSANDRQVVSQVMPPSRVLIWEQTNYAPGAEQLFYAGTDPATVTLHLQPDTGVPLLIDGEDEDTICDDLQLVDAVTLEDLPRQNLVPIPPEGNSWFRRPEEEDHPDLGLSPSMGTLCDYSDTGSEPEPLCNPPRSDLVRVISQVVGSSNPSVNDSAIYAIGQLTDAICTGRQWQISSIVGVEEGWVCLAARAEDFANNVGISAPLRLCYDDPDVAGVPACADGSDPPSCTDGCDLPPRFPASLVAVD